MFKKMFEFNGHNMYVNMGTDICLKNIDHLQVFDIGDVDIGYVGPHISGPAPALIEVPLQDNDNDDGEEKVMKITTMMMALKMTKTTT